MVYSYFFQASLSQGGNWSPQHQVITDWHSGLSPYPYELVLRSQHSCVMCYGGCGTPYTENDAFIVRHLDRRVVGKDAAGNLLFNSQFKPAYYHASYDHICQKNYRFNGSVNIARTLADSLPVEVLKFIETSGRITLNVVES